MDGTRIVSEAALEAGVKKFVYCSSLAAFDLNGLDGLLDETAPRPTSSALPVYGRSKWQAEVEIGKAIEKGLNAVICNPAGIYGPKNHPSCRLNKMILRAAHGRLPIIFEGKFNMVDVRDVAEGLIAASERGACGENYLLAGHMIDLQEILQEAARLGGNRAPRIVLPLTFVNNLIGLLEPLGKLLGSKVINRGIIDMLLCSPKVDCKKAVDKLCFKLTPPEKTIPDLIRCDH